MDRDKFEAAVARAGGPEVAGEYLGRSASTISRWIRGKASPTRSQEGAVERFIKAYPDDPARRPLHTYLDAELLAEIAFRLKHPGIRPDRQQGRPSAGSVTEPVSAPEAQGAEKRGRSRLVNVDDLGAKREDAREPGIRRVPGASD